MKDVYINKISIEKNGIYLSTKYRSSTHPYHSGKSESLTKAYENGGQEALDKELVRMFLYNYEAKGFHKSVKPFKKLLKEKPVVQALYLFNITTTHEWENLSTKDQYSCYSLHPSHDALEYLTKRDTLWEECIDNIYEIFKELNPKRYNK